MQTTGLLSAEGREEEKKNHSSSPEVLVHRLEEEFVVWLVQDLFKIQQSDVFGSNGYLHQIRRLLFVDVIDYFGFRHVYGYLYSPPFQSCKSTTRNTL